MKILIVGGGSSGWMVASALIRYFPNYKISVVESNKIPTIGVGESTTALVRQFILNNLKIDEFHFMKNTNAIYKMSVKFKNFSKNKNHEYHYPFGWPDTKEFNEEYIYAWDLVKYFNKNICAEDFVKFMYPSYYLFSKNKINENLNNEFDNFNFNMDLGYHFDANKVGKYLKENYCIPKGVKVINSEVLDVEFFEEKIQNLILNNGEKIYADLFIDCTGFKSFLLGKKMKSKFIDVSSKMLNNRAWAVPIEYKNLKKQMQPYTTATAIENGWAWYTPISNRIGNGYSYSDKFVEPEQALVEFKNYLKLNNLYDLTDKELKKMPFFEIKSRVGFYEESMIKNVVGIGLSSGFLEPLEGTGIHFVVEQITYLCKILNNEEINQFLIDSFNLKTKILYETWIETLLMIYISSKKRNNDYWKSIYEMKNVNLDLKNISHYHAANDYMLRLYNVYGHNYVSDLYNNVTRGSEFINFFTELDMDLFLMYNSENEIKNKYEKYLNIFKEKTLKWENNSKSSQHVYDFLKLRNGI